MFLAASNKFRVGNISEDVPNNHLPLRMIRQNATDLLNLNVCLLERKKQASGKTSKS